MHQQRPKGKFQRKPAHNGWSASATSPPLSAVSTGLNFPQADTNEEALTLTQTAVQEVVDQMITDVLAKWKLEHCRFRMLSDRNAHRIQQTPRP